MPAFTSTEWQQYKQRRDPQKYKPVANPRKRWQWESKRLSGVEGVDTHKDQIMWYEHAHNQHGHGGAYMQSYEDFMESGPHIRLPNNQILDELYDAVRTLAQE